MSGIEVCLEKDTRVVNCDLKLLIRLTTEAIDTNNFRVELQLNSELLHCDWDVESHVGNKL